MSENIRVRSIIGRFLEHSRVYYFYANGEEKTFCSSADWMQRNFFRRVETAFPIHDARLRQRVAAESLEMCLLDNQQAWHLGEDGRYSPSKSGKQKPVSSQETLLEVLAETTTEGKRGARVLKAARLRSMRIEPDEEGEPTGAAPEDAPGITESQLQAPPKPPRSSAKEARLRSERSEKREPGSRRKRPRAG